MNDVESSDSVKSLQQKPIEDCAETSDSESESAGDYISASVLPNVADDLPSQHSHDNGLVEKSPDVHGTLTTPTNHKNKEVAYSSSSVPYKKLRVDSSISGVDSRSNTPISINSSISSTYSVENRVTAKRHSTGKCIKCRKAISYHLYPTKYS